MSGQSSDSGAGHFLQTERLRFHYRRHGDPDGLPLLLIHGGFATSRWWTRLFEYLPGDYCAIAPDLRGCGLTEKPDAGYEIESQSEDLAAFTDGVGLRDFDLVAHAAGAAVAVEYCLTHPETVHSLCLVSSVPIEGVVTPPEALRLLEQMRTEPLLLRSALAALMPATVASRDPLFDLLVADAAAMAPAAYSQMTLALAQWNRLAEARELTLPTLLVWGDADPLVSRDSITRTLLAIPGAANLEVLQGVGHCPMLDAPLAFAERLVDFVTEDFAGLASLRERGLSNE